MLFDSKNTPPPRGGSYLVCSLIKNLEEEDPPRKIYTRCFEGIPIGNPPGGGGVLSIILLATMEIIFRIVECTRQLRFHSELYTYNCIHKYNISCCYYWRQWRFHFANCGVYKTMYTPFRIVDIEL